MTEAEAAGLLRRLGRAIRGDAKLDAGDGAALEAMMPLAAFGCFYADRRNGGAVPEGCLRAYRGQAMHSLPQEAARKSVAALLTAEGLRFAWIKGAALGYGVYPTPALRPMGDLDLLLHPEDCDRALEALRRDGWSARYQYEHGHHYPVMRRGGVALEPHFRMPHFPDCPMAELWRVLLPGEGGEFRLSSELHLLLLFQHSRGHGWRNGIQLLMDTAMLTRADRVDWPRLRELARRFGVPSPELLFAAFPELLPPPDAAPAAEVTAEFRALILESFRFGAKRYELLLTGADYLSSEWWRERLAGMRGTAVRIRYQLPPRGHYGLLLRCMLLNMWGKGRYFLRFSRRAKDPEIVRYLRRLKQVEDCCAAGERRGGEHSK